ncbi:MAG: Lrp/AsnC family transcriptional regulator [Archaeoglobi archaeon]|nr:Lrp/AsnC family transcriptional regulator [Candidatus Mnemosynella sp.]
MSIRDRVIEYLRSKPGGVYQKDIWKDLGIDSRSCSRVLLELERRGIIERERVAADGVVTYRIKLRDEGGRGFIFELISRALPPCIGCREECEPGRCSQLDLWVRVVFDGNLEV